MALSRNHAFRSADFLQCGKALARWGCAESLWPVHGQQMVNQSKVSWPLPTSLHASSLRSSGGINSALRLHTYGLDRACPKNERPEKLCRDLRRKLCRNASGLTDSFDKGCDKVCDEDAIGRFWDKLYLGSEANRFPLTALTSHDLAPSVMVTAPSSLV